MESSKQRVVCWWCLPASLSPPHLLEVSFSSFLIFSQRNQSLVCFPVACAWVGGAWLEPGCWRESWKECAPGCALGMEMHAFGTTEERPALSVPPPEPASQGRPAQTPHRRESQAGADVSAGLCGRSASQPTETRLLPGAPGLAFLPRRCREHRPELPVLPGGGGGVGCGEALLLASRKVTVQIGCCCWLEPGSHLL